MDGNDRRRSQYGQPYQTQAPSRPLPGQAMGPPSSDRYAQPTTPARSDIGSSPLTRPYLASYPGYGYQEPQYGGAQMQGSSPMQGVEMQYSPAYIQEARRQQQVQGSPSQQQQQQYAQYGPSSMLPPVGPQSLYENIPFQQRQIALEVMASQFSVPQYLPPGEAPGVEGAGPSSSQYLTTQPEQSSYGVVPVTRAPLPRAYAGGQAEFSGMEQQETAGSPVQDTHQTALSEALREYHQQLRSTFDAIIAGRLTEAGEQLLTISRWLVNSVTALGLHHDDEAQHAERLELWRNLNLCWEALGQKQKEVTEEALRTTRQPTDMLSTETLTHMVDELITMCDHLEPHGLVDFEMGLWEEQITHIFTLCIDLLPHNEPTRSDPAAGAQAESS